MYFTVIVENDSGQKSQTSCYLPTYDVTLPNGRFQEEFITSSNPDELRAAVKIHEDSELVQNLVGLGYGKGIYGDQSVRWHDISFDDYTHIHIGYYYTVISYIVIVQPHIMHCTNYYLTNECTGIDVSHEAKLKY